MPNQHRNSIKAMTAGHWIAFIAWRSNLSSMAGDGGRFSVPVLRVFPFSLEPASGTFCPAGTAGSGAFAAIAGVPVESARAGDDPAREAHKARQSSSMNLDIGIPFGRSLFRT